MDEDDDEERERGAERAHRIHSTLGSSIVRRTSITTAAGRTILSGIKPVLEVGQVIDEHPAEDRRGSGLDVNPKASPQAPPSRAVPAVTSGRARETGTRRAAARGAARSSRAGRRAGRRAAPRAARRGRPRRPRRLDSRVAGAFLPLRIRRGSPRVPQHGDARITRPVYTRHENPFGKRGLVRALHSIEGCPSLVLGAMRPTFPVTVGSTADAPRAGHEGRGE